MSYAVAARYKSLINKQRLSEYSESLLLSPVSQCYPKALSQVSYAFSNSVLIYLLWHLMSRHPISPIEYKADKELRTSVGCEK